MRAPLEIRVHDASVGIWQDNAWDPTFRDEVYGELIRRMRARGWSIRFDPHIRRHFSILNSCHRLGARGTLRCAIRICGRAVEMEFWSTTAKQVNHNGRRYDFDRMSRMHHLDRLRVELELRRTIAWLETIAPVEVKRAAERDMPAMARIAMRYAESWRTEKTLGRPNWNCDGQRESKDGMLLDQGQTVWLPDSKGRIVRGTAFYNINNMWWVVAGGRLYNEGSRALYAAPPPDLRLKRNERSRRRRLEEELGLAMRRMAFLCAETLKRLLFGDDQVFLIWARDKNAYYRPQYSGYTTDVISAGRYTRAEAERECRRVPHELSMIDRDGNQTRFDERSAQ